MTNINLESQIGGRYRLEIHRADGSIRDVYEFDNLITNQGFNYIQTNAVTVAINWCSVGTGNATPLVTDTGLQSPLAYQSESNATYSALAASPYTASTTFGYYFAQGAAAGNLSEIGVGWANNNTSLFSRALILDSLGNPTTITVLSNEYLYAYYTVYLNPPLTDATGTVTLGGTSYSWTSRAAMAGSSVWCPQHSLANLTTGGNINLYTGPLAAITAGNTTGTNLAVFSNMTSSATNGVVTYTINLTPTQGNLAGGISTIFLNQSVLAYTPAIGDCQFQFNFSPAIPKDSTKSLSLSFTHTITRI